MKEAGEPARAGGYRGTLALNVAVPDRPREIVLVALDVWEHACVLRGAATLDREDPFWLPSSWGIATDVPTSHQRRGGGGGSLGWLVNFEPRLPDAATQIRVFVGPDNQRPRSNAPLPDDPTVVVDLSN